MTTIPQVARAMREMLTTTAAEAGRATRFVQRPSPLSGATFSPDLGVWVPRESPGDPGSTHSHSGHFGRRD